MVVGLMEAEVGVAVGTWQEAIRRHTNLGAGVGVGTEAFVVQKPWSVISYVQRQPFCLQVSRSRIWRQERGVEVGVGVGVEEEDSLFLQ